MFGKYDKSLEHLTVFEDKDSEELYFVKLLENRHIFAWESRYQDGGFSHYARRIPLSQVPIETLKQINIWDNLTDGEKSELQRLEEGEVQGTHAHMEKMRRRRRMKYEGVPREVVCCGCGLKQKMAPAQIVKRAEKEVRSIENWVKEFRCQKCNPVKRGRKADPKYAHLPKELVCKCGNKVNTSPSAIVTRAKKLGITPEEVVNQYVCQKCAPTKGRHKRKKSKKKS
jgi:hypothetical protein